MATKPQAAKTRPTISEQAQAKIVNPNERANVPALQVNSRLPMPIGLTDVDARQWRVLVETTFPSARTPEAVVMALDYCKARNLDIFRKPVHIVPMWNSTLGREVETVWPGINEIQVTAARTGAFAGMDEPKWGPDRTMKFSGRRRENNSWVNAEIELTIPESCAVTVYRLVNGVRCPFTEPVFWLEAYSTSGGRASKLPTDMWVKRPRGQLHKVAKAASLRAAFPEEGEYTAEEMEGKEIEHGGVPMIDVTAVTVPSAPAAPPDAPGSSKAPPPPSSAPPTPNTQPAASAGPPPKVPTSPKPKPASAVADAKRAVAEEHPAPQQEPQPEPPDVPGPGPHPQEPWRPLTIERKGHSFESYTTAYIKLMSEAPDAASLSEFEKLNDEGLRFLKAKAEILPLAKEQWERIAAAQDRMLQSVRSAPPERTTDSMEAEPAPSKTLRQEASEQLPDPGIDPEAAIQFVGRKLATFSDYGAAEDYWNDVIAPTESKWLPPDWDEIIGLLRATERRLAP